MESTTYMVAGQEFELKHYGVKGMKWGVKKAQEEYANLGSLRSTYREAKKNRRNAVGFKARRQAKVEYKQAKADFKAKKKEIRRHTTIGQKLGRGVQKTNQTLHKVGNKTVTIMADAKNRGSDWIDNWVRNSDQ